MPDDPIAPVPPPDEARDAPTIAEGEQVAGAIPAERPAVVIGRYKLLKELGKGGFGIVWLAEQTEPIRREVALKVIKAGMDSREVIARFEAERQALALMDHPNIAAVLDAGTTERGLPYFVMELVKGVPITEYCDTRQLGIRERLELFIPVCQAVQHAHQKAILHRDLKPSNILVAEVDGKPVPKVIDFGIAKALSASPEEVLQASLALTQEGMVVGTPQYMSPEQAGSVPDVDTRSDLYTLGVILYELLVGETPLSKERLKRAALDEVLRLVREGEPQRPSSRFIPATERGKTTAGLRHTEPRKLGHALRGDLDWIVLKALEKDRARRYDTANAFALDLRRHLDHEPVSAGPPSAGYRLRKLVRRNRLAFGAATAILVLLVAGITASTWQAVRATKAEKLAEGRRVQAEQSAKAEAIQRHEAEEQTRKTEAAATQARENLSQSDFFQALRSIDEDRNLDALAQLTRSLALNPQNHAALCRLATLLAYHSFALPISGMKHDTGVVSAQFSPDGKWILTLSDNNIMRVWDAQSGQPHTDLKRHIDAAQFSLDGKRIVTASEDEDSTAQVWDAQTGRPLTDPMKLEGRAAQFSSDGKWFVTASADQTAETARVWDVQSGKLLTHAREFLGNTASFSPDGRRIVATLNYSDGTTVQVDDARTGKPMTLAVSDGTKVGVWDAQSGKPMTKPMKHDARVHSAQFSPDGKRIVTASGNRGESGAARVWDAQTGKPLTKPMKHDNEVHWAQFSPDGKWILTVSGLGGSRPGYETARVWNAQSGQPVSEPLKHDEHADRVRWAQFSPDGNRIVIASADSRGETARVWDTQTGQPLTEPMKHDDGVNLAQFSPDGTRIVTADGTVRVWDALSGKSLTEPMKHDGEVNSAQFSPDGKRIVTISSGTTRVWDAQSGQPLTKPMEHDSWVLSAQFSPDGKRIVTASNDKTARVWDAQSGKPLIAPLKHDDEVNSAQFSPDGKRIVTASRDKTARIWDAQTGRPLTDPMKHDGVVLSAHFSQDGKRIVTASDDKTSRVWDAQTGQLVTGPLKDDGWVNSAEFSPDGKRILGSSGQVWDTQRGQMLTGPLLDAHTARFSPDGKRIVTSSFDGTARVWDAQNGQSLTKPMTHDDRVLAAQFSQDGTQIVTASRDKTARVWDAQTGQPLTEFLKHDDEVYSARFSPDGKRIVTASADTTARVWDVSARGPMPAWLPRLAEAVAGKHLNNRGVFEPLKEDPIRVLQEIRTQLSTAPDDDDWTIWGRWFLADRSTRTISPFSKITFPEYIENRIKENTPASLDEAERLAVGNAGLLQRIEQARKASAKRVAPSAGKEQHAR